VERGYALTLLTENPDLGTIDRLQELTSQNDSELMELWLRAALVEVTSGPGQLLDLVSGQSSNPDVRTKAWVLSSYPELQRPIALKLSGWSQALSLEQSLRFLGYGQSMGSARGVTPNISMVLEKSLREASIDSLCSLMFSSPDQEVRRLSAGLLASRAQSKPDAVFTAVTESLALRPGADQVPWAGGALFVPQFTGLNKNQAVELIGSLVRWSVWTQLHGTSPAQVQPLENNLRSYSLWSVAGGDGSGWRQANGAEGWLKAYRSVAGEKAAAGILREQDVSRGSDLWIIVK
jgi:hypothetical protein